MGLNVQEPMRRPILLCAFRSALAALFIASLWGCSREAKPESEGYRVVSYDSTTGKWVIIRTGTFDGKFLKKRMTITCDFYKWADHEPVEGPRACSLQVGRLMVPNSLSGKAKGQAFLDIWEMSPDRLVVTEGEGPDMVSQQFVVLKNEVLPD